LLHHSIIARCYCRTNANYPQYGGRGISVCKRWRESAEAFAADMGPSTKHIVGRRNREGSYTPGNCYWALRTDGGARIGRLITYQGKRQNMARWAAELGITRESMRQRVKKCVELGLPLTAAISSPRKRGRPRKK
jgi:hypothetical protein